MLVADGGSLECEFVKVEGGFQNFVLGHVFPERDSYLDSRHEGGGGSVCRASLAALVP